MSQTSQPNLHLMLSRVPFIANLAQSRSTCPQGVQWPLEYKSYRQLKSSFSYQIILYAGFKEVFATETHLVICMEHARCGQLDAWIEANGRLTEGRARLLFLQMADAMTYCHRYSSIYTYIMCQSLKCVARMFTDLMALPQSLETFQGMQPILNSN